MLEHLVAQLLSGTICCQVVKAITEPGMFIFLYKIDKAYFFNFKSKYRHAACPVLFGTKWVSNRWIHEVGQEFRRPCALEKEEIQKF